MIQLFFAVVFSGAYILTLRKLQRQKDMTATALSVIGKLSATILYADQAYEDGDDKIARAWVERMAMEIKGGFIQG